MPSSSIIFFFFFNDTATTEIYTLSLHDALPIYVHITDVRILLNLVQQLPRRHAIQIQSGQCMTTSSITAQAHAGNIKDRKSTRLNSSHLVISYAVFCLKKKKQDHVLRNFFQWHN